MPYGVAVDDRPPERRSKAATNDAADHRKALLLIGSILGTVLMLVVLGTTVLRPIIMEQRERTLIRITNEQLDMLAGMVDRIYIDRGELIISMDVLLLEEQLETSDGRDLWGTRFVLSTEPAGEEDRTLLVIRSAGPDRSFDTADDLVIERLLSAPQIP